jgi:uncharacterized protein
MFQTAMLTILACSLAWWVWAHVWVRRLPRTGRWRLAIAAFAVAQVGMVVWVLASRMGGVPMPTPFQAWVYLWNLVVLPLAVLTAGVSVAVWCVDVAWRWWRRRAKAGGEPQKADGPTLSRRQVLAASVVAGPPLLCGVGLAKGLWELDEFRVRRIEVGLEGLPPDLEGVSLAHVADVHVGRYTRGRVLDEVARRVNALRCDAVLMPGDLIDHALADLPEAAAMVRRFDAPVYLCEGNHDLFEGREAFGAGLASAGLRLLRNQADLRHIRGVPVQFLGLRWGGPGAGRGAKEAENLAEIGRLREPGAFQVLLAHHPHAFDGAAEMGIPLTLAGHTHGGQLMVSDDAGAGPVLFKYWSGLYRRAGSDGVERACVVSNGVGNWFPLRLNAPAEVVQVVLRRA